MDEKLIKEDINEYEKEIQKFKNNTGDYFKKNLDIAVELSNIEKEETMNLLDTVKNNSEELIHLVNNFLIIEKDFEGIEALANKISMIRKKCESLSKKFQLEIN
jgi:hypothetical protein